MKVTAAVYRQDTPMSTGRKFRGEYGNEMPEHEANFVHIGDVSGSYDECWQQAKKLTPKPVLEFPIEMYRYLREL